MDGENADSSSPGPPLTPPSSALSPLAPATPMTPPSAGLSTGATPSTIGRSRILTTPLDVATPGTPRSASRFQSESGETQATVHERTVIWGTNINTRSAIESVKGFLTQFEKDENLPYMDKLVEVIDLSLDFLNIDCHDIWRFNQKLCKQLTSFPMEMLPLVELAVHELLLEKDPSAEITHRVQVRLFHLMQVKNMRDLDPDDIDKLVSIRGMVTRCSGIIPELREAYFQCSVCSFSREINVLRGRVTEPHRCPRCSTLQSMVLLHNRGKFSNKQVVKLQEAPENIPEGETPHTLVCLCFDELVDAVKPGDRVTVTGVVCAEGRRLNPRARTIQVVFSTYLSVNHFQRTQQMVPEAVSSATDSLLSPVETQFDISSTMSTAEKEEMKELGRDPHIVDRLIDSFAPSVFGLNEVKKGLLCQLFGGTRKEFTQSGSGRFRGEINILMCGDPSTAKSQLLQYVHKLAPRGIYTSGKGSSAVGLTATVTRDPDTREAMLESGALVLSDRGICCIDEFDKMADVTRAALHEAMEQQTISIAKAGIVCTLNARTSILAAANPRDSMYNKRLSVVENIQLPPTLLSRFDLIYLVLDKPDPELDRKLALHLASMYAAENPNEVLEEERRVDFRTLAKYIAFARSYYEPQLSDAACNRLCDSYLEMRRRGGGSRKIITATPRQLESLIRTSEALARMRLSSEVVVEDVVEAKKLVEDALQNVATDSVTGIIDMDLIYTGISQATRQGLVAVVQEVLDSAGSRKKLWKFSELLGMVDRYTKSRISASNLLATLNSMSEDKLVIEERPGQETLIRIL